MKVEEGLLRICAKNNLIKESDIESIILKSKEENISIRQYLYENYGVSEKSELKALSEYYHIPAIEIGMFSLDKELIDFFTLEYLKKNKIVPIVKTENNVLVCATSCPLDVNTYSSMKVLLSCDVEFVLASESDIISKLDSISAQVSMTNALMNIHEEKEEEVKNVEEDTLDNPSVRLVDSIIKEAIPLRASDIHIEPFEKYVKVRYRIDGDLLERATFPIKAYSQICARIKIMSGINIAERRVPQDGRIKLNIGDVEYDFRVSTLPTVNGEKFVIRILDKTSFKFTRDDLCFTKEENRIIDKMISKPHGIILLTGPTGCGKSTTLYSFLKELNNPRVNIITVEDPVEYTMDGISQIQVNNKANMTFAAALRSILRQDPDIIMVGEIRDEETAKKLPKV